MVKEEVKKAEKAEEIKAKAEEGAVKAGESAEKAKEVPSEAAPEGITDKTKDSTDSAEEPTEKTEEPTEKTEESTEKTEESTEKVEDSKDSNDSTESTPTGISDEELSRVFEAIPKKSKVALDRVESRMDNVKGAKSSPVWFPWVFSIIMIIGLVWAVVYYLTGNYPIPHIGAWNLCISFVTILVGFAMTMFWK